MRLSKQSIRKLCVGVESPMIHPFEPSKVRVAGVSKGLSHASYDASIAHDLVLGRHPGYVIKEWALRHLSVLIGAEMQRNGNGLTHMRPLWWLSRIPRTVQVVYTLLVDLGTLAKALRDEPPAYALAHTVEDFHMPANVGGDVADKSTFARVFVSAYNTFFDPGFHGNATLELVNDSDKRVEYKAGQGVCQFIFTWLDEPTEEPYSGKYQGQTKAAHGPRYERDGRWVASKPGADGVVLHKRPPGERTAAERQADEDRQRRHGGDTRITTGVLDEALRAHDRRNAAEATLTRLGWRWAGGVDWKPPLGKPPAYVSDGPGCIPECSGTGPCLCHPAGDMDYEISQETKDRWADAIIEAPKLSAGAPTPYAPVAATATQGPAPEPVPLSGCTSQEQAANLSRYRWGEKPSGLDKYAGQPDHAVRGWEPK